MFSNNRSVPESYTWPFTLTNHVAETARRDGLLESCAEGRIEGIFVSVQCLMTSMGLTLEQAMNALSISEEERSTCRGFMKNSN